MDESLILIAKSFWMEPDNYWAILKVLVGLGAVIFVHELGHFLLAKACGVKCEKFYVGFDVPLRLFGTTLIPGKLIHFQWGETEYGVGAIPLGGYVKMLGQDDNPGNYEEQIRGSMVEGETPESALLESGLVDRSKLDPRSYLAKSVIQRMMIISAGVIFNLIFAIFFAAFAFKSGVDYEPPVLGNVVGGGPAWKYDMVGADVRAVGDKQVEGYFPYMSFAEQVIFNGDDSKIPVTFIPYGETEPVTVELTPEKGFRREMADLAMIGVGGALDPVIGDLGTIEGTPAAQADPPMQVGDRVIEVNGTPIRSEIDLRQTLARDAALPATFVLERQTGTGKSQQTTTVTTTVGVNPVRDLGFGTSWGPVARIKIGSPADGRLQEGDQILQINGQAPQDLLTFDLEMTAVARDGGTVQLQIQRAGTTLNVELQPIIPKLYSNVGPNKPIAIDSLGVAIEPRLDVAYIAPGGSAAAAGMQSGDVLVAVEYLLNEQQRQIEAYASILKDPLVNFVDDNTSWAEVNELLQQMEPGTAVALTVQRGDTEQVLKLNTQASSEFFQAKRGFSLKPMQVNYRSETWNDAMQNGFRQVGREMTRVLTTLTELIRGKISPKNLGGPGTIAVAATSEATQSTSRLLLFLTFLSANLAIVNFLPIPVLDGGHMLFLAYEGIVRRPVNERVQVVLTYGGLLFILGLMAFVIFLDVGRIGSLF